MTSGEYAQKATIVPSHRTYQAGLLVVLFAAALIVRLYRIDAPPFDAHATRQFHSALLARKMYFEHVSVPVWRLEMAELSAPRPIEPPILEWLSVQGYLLAGREDLTIPRVLSAVFWLVGGYFLYRLTRLLAGVDEAFIATAYYLLSPYAVRSSRTFQPEPMMIMLGLVALWFIVTWSQTWSIRRALLAGSFSALAIFVKPPAVFTLAPIGALMLVQGERSLRAMFAPDVAIFIILVSLPVAYYFVRMFFDSGMSAQFSTQFQPDFWGSQLHWSGWFQVVGRVFGYTPFIGGVLGAFVTRQLKLQMLLSGWWIGYLVMGLTFSYATATHDYYQLQYVPLIGLSLAVLLGPVTQHLAEVLRLPMTRIILVISLVLLASALRARELRFGIGAIEPISESLATAAPQIGRLVDHSERAIMISQSYCGPLQFYGEITGICWPTRNLLLGNIDLSAEEFFEQAAGNAEFLVVTDMEQWNAQPGLQTMVRQYPLIGESEQVLIYDLR